MTQELYLGFQVAAAQVLFVWLDATPRFVFGAQLVGLCTSTFCHSQSILEARSLVCLKAWGFIRSHHLKAIVHRRS